MYKNLEVVLFVNVDMYSIQIGFSIFQFLIFSVILLCDITISLISCLVLEQNNEAAEI